MSSGEGEVVALFGFDFVYLLFVFEAEEAFFGSDQVVDHRHLDKLAYGRHPFGYVDIAGRGPQLAAWMIVHQDQLTTRFCRAKLMYQVKDTWYLTPDSRDLTLDSWL